MIITNKKQELFKKKRENDLPFHSESEDVRQLTVNGY
jgi:hypothetical protein